MKSYRDKTIWIIGASTGIGYALAKTLSERGVNLILSARDEAKLKELNQALNNRHQVQEFDVQDLSAIQSAVARIQDSGHIIDSVIFLAALYEPGRLGEISPASMARQVNVNLMGCLNVVYAVLPALQKQQSGQLALCGSVAGYRGLPNGQPYSATKAAVVSIAQSLKIENPELDIKVINPGFVRTQLTKKNDFSMPMLLEPSQAAEYIAGGLLTRHFEIHFPKRFTWFMKFLQFIPISWYFRLFGKLGGERDK